MKQPSLRARLALAGLIIGAVLLALTLAGFGLASAAATTVQLRPAAAELSITRCV